jgi:poly [ADP-ribose] polymerase
VIPTESEKHDMFIASILLYLCCGFQLVERLSDIMTFGALERCDECSGQFVFCSGVGYQCRGNLTGWTKCQNTTLEPKRKPFKVPPELSSDHEFL